MKKRKMEEKQIYYDIELFREIKIEINKHPKEYQEAGKWLDEYCSVDNFWKRQEKALESEKKYGFIPLEPGSVYVNEDGTAMSREDSEKKDQRELLIYEKTVEYLELMIKLKKGYFRLKWLIDNWKKQPEIFTRDWLKNSLNAMGEVAGKTRLDDAYDFLTVDVARSLFMSLKDARCIILITWLLYDPDSENSGLNLTEFESWPWSSRLHSTQKFLACYRNERTGTVEDNKWMVRVRIAWDEIQAEKKVEVERKTKQETEPAQSNITGMTQQKDEKKLEFKQKHRDFLRKIANEVYELVRNPATMARFREQVKLFFEKNEEHQNEVEQLKKASKADSKLQAAIEKLEKESWGKTWDEMTDKERMQVSPEDDLPIKLPEGYESYVWVDGFCISPKTADLWLYLTPPTAFVRVLDLRSWDNETARSSEDEKIISCYTLLAAIHDQNIPEKPICTNMVYNGSRHLHDKWIQQLNQKCRCVSYLWEQDGCEGGKDTRAWIERALNDVKADLAKIESAEPEQENKSGKSQWQPPKRCIGSKAIVSDYKIPRSTLQGWAERDKVKAKKDPQTNENYYPEKWFEKQIKNYRKRNKK